MAEIGSGNGSDYPTSLDTDSTQEVNGTAGTKARAEVVNDLGNAVVKIQTELGTSPSGTLTDVKTFLQTEHDTDGTHGNITPTKITMQGSGLVDLNGSDIQIDDANGILDANGNELVRFQTIASAVNQIDISNAATGNNAIIEATGDDTNIGIDFKAKGTGTVNMNGSPLQINDGDSIVDANKNELVRFQTIASAVNQMDVSNAATGNNPIIEATGGDTNIGIDFKTKGTGVVDVTASDLHVGGESALRGIKNKLTNGNFRIWQRGTSFALAASQTKYTADRWVAVRDATATAYTISKQTSGPPSGSLNYIRIQRNNAESGLGALRWEQPIPTDTLIGLQGKKVTLSFYARKGANYSPASAAFSLYKGTGTESKRGFVAFTGETSQAITFTPTTSWAKYTLNFTTAIPSGTTQGAVQFVFTPTSTAGAADYIDFAQMQLEVGAVATAYEYRPESLELNSCRWFFERIDLSDTSTQRIPAVGYFGSTARLNAAVAFAKKRSVPSITSTAAGTFQIQGSGVASATATAIGFILISRNSCLIQVDNSAAPYTAGYAGEVVRLATNTTYIDIDSEL